MFPTFLPEAKYCIFIVKVVQFHYLYSQAFTVAALNSRALQLSGMLMYVAYLVSLYQSVNSSVWGLCVFMCACSCAQPCVYNRICL